MNNEETFYLSIVTTKVVPIQEINKGSSITFLSREGGQMLRRIGKVTDVGDEVVVVNNLYRVEKKDVERFYVTLPQNKVQTNFLKNLFSPSSSKEEVMVPVSFSCYQYVKDSIRVEFKLQERDGGVVAFVKPKKDLDENEVRALGQLIKEHRSNPLLDKDFERGIDFLKLLSKNGFRITKAKKTYISEIQSTTA